jgi:hypothetical protein
VPVRQLAALTLREGGARLREGSMAGRNLPELAPQFAGRAVQGARMPLVASGHASRPCGLEQLLHMKLLAMRPHDIVHIADLMRIGLVDRSWRDRVPEPLRERFDRAAEQYEQHCRDSAH